MFGEGVATAKHKSVEWYTPKWVFDELGIQFDLDPASPHDMDSHVPAVTKYTVFDDGLSQAWNGTVWMNPPYGRTTGAWIRRFIAHGDGIALVFSRTDAKWFQEMMNTCTGMIFLAGRIEFVPGLENQHKKSRCGAGTAMFSFGDRATDALKNLSDRGFFFDKRVSAVNQGA